MLAAHEDHSGEADQAGVKTTLVTSSPFKAEASEFGPLTDEARAEMQSKVDYYHGLFVSAVARGRGTTEARVKSGYGQGRVMTAKQALDAGMVDQICTLEQLLKKMANGDNGAGPSARSTPVCRLSPDRPRPPRCRTAPPCRFAWIKSSGSWNKTGERAGSRGNRGGRLEGVFLAVRPRPPRLLLQVAPRY